MGVVIWGEKMEKRNGNKKAERMVWPGTVETEKASRPSVSQSADSWDFIPLPGACVVSVGCGSPGSILGVGPPIPVSSSV